MQRVLTTGILDYSGKHIDFPTVLNSSRLRGCAAARDREAPYLFQPETGEVVHLPEVEPWEVVAWMGCPLPG